MKREMTIPFVDLKAQRLSIREEIDGAIADVMDACAFIKGSHVEQFEREFVAHCKAGHCVGVGNGTDALFLALKAFGVGPGDEVLVPAMTFIATAEAVTMAGAVPVFVDIDPSTYTLCPADLQKKLTPESKAVIPVHLYGHPADMRAIGDIASAKDLVVIQDAAQAHGASLDGKPLSAFSPCACYSFFPSKNLGAYGDAGAVVLNDAARAGHARKLSNHGRDNKYIHEFEGVNSRLDGLQAAVLSVKLRHLDRWTKARQDVAAFYDAGLSGAQGITPPARAKGAGHVYHLYVLQCDKRDDLRAFLSAKGIATGIHYPIALPFMPAYAAKQHRPEEFPVAHALQAKGLSLPMFPELTQRQMEYVVQAIREWSDSL